MSRCPLSEGCFLNRIRAKDGCSCEQRATSQKVAFNDWDKLRIFHAVAVRQLTQCGGQAEPVAICGHRLDSAGLEEQLNTKPVPPPCAAGLNLTNKANCLFDATSPCPKRLDNRCARISATAERKRSLANWRQRHRLWHLMAAPRLPNALRKIPRPQSRT